MKTLFLFVFIMLLLNTLEARTAIQGTVTDARTGEPLAGVSVYLSNRSAGSSTNAVGSFELMLDLPAQLVFSYLGYEPLQLTIDNNTRLPLQIKLTEQQNNLQEAVVKAQANKTETRIGGPINLQPQELRFLPSAGGDRDPLHALTLMPGIKKSGGGGEGFFVRGGSPDQNLFLVDGAQVYNPGHLLGFFSAFNTDAVSEINAWKGSFPAAYGGRLSSVIQINLKDGNQEKWETQAGMGLLSSRIQTGGPITKNLSIAMGYRHSHIETLYGLAGNPLPYGFQDFNLKLNYRLGNNARLSYTQFYAQDQLDFEPGTRNNQVAFGTRFVNAAYVLKYQHTLNKNQLNVWLIHSRFNYQVKAGIDQNAFGLKSDISDYQLKAEYNRYVNSTVQIKSGAELIQHTFNPNQTSIFGSINELLKQFNSKTYGTVEMAAYTQANLQLGRQWKAEAGIRFSGAAGPWFAYTAPEPRLQVSKTFGSNQIQLSYNRMMQYMHLVSSSSAVMPTDIWFPVSGKVKPQQSHQLSATYMRSLYSNTWQIEIEPYAKWMQNLVEYKEGTQVLLNNSIENDLIQGKGRAYGIEFMLRKKTGKLSGWLAYTLSVTQRQFDELNQGLWYYARYDRRHDLNLVANYAITPQLVLSSTFTLGSGMRVTPVTGRYAMPTGSYNEIITVPVYGQRNSMVLSPIHRLDINLTWTAPVYRKIHSEWSIGAVNVYNRTQAFKLSMNTDAAGNLHFKQVGLYGFIPSVSCNIKF